MRLIGAYLLLVLIAGCGGGAGGDGGPTIAAPGCTGTCSLTMPTALTVAEVNRILSQAVQEAQARGMLGTIAVVDRSGNVLAVFQMTGAAGNATITSGRGVVATLEGAIVPSALAAISKAITGAYLSSEGNAFTSRTANQIVQQNFNPGEIGSPGGPLFGVQFSSLSCSDVVLGAAGTAGPHGAPLGLSADPGGLPLYKNGLLVGGIGVIADAVYGVDLDITSTVDSDLDELIAVAGTSGFNAPTARRADRITVDGRTLRFTDSEAVVSNPAAAPANPTAGALLIVPGYKTASAVTAGTLFNTAASGYRQDNTGAFSGLNAFVLVDGGGIDRFPLRSGTDGLLTQAEVTQILAEAIRVANRARAQIRLPLGSPAQVNISVVDTNGTILGLIRTPDAPVFGTDVAVQKARTAMFFSRTNAAATINAAGLAIDYIGISQAFIPGGNAFANGIAHSNRSIGNLARPFFPDGINANGPGPLSRPFASWSPFATGLQLDLVVAQVAGNLAGVLNSPCSAVSANGIQIFPGGFPIYRGTILIGGIGISGDGIDQDDLVGFLGVANAGAILNTGVAHAPAVQRADTISGLPGGQLRYVSCPIAPFLDTTATNVCDGL